MSARAAETTRGAASVAAAGGALQGQNVGSVRAALGASYDIDGGQQLVE